MDHPCAACDIRLRTFCKTLDAEELRRFKADGPTVAVAAKQPLFHEGERANVVFNLTKGSAKLYKLLPDGRRQVTGFLFPGDFLGVTVDDEHAFSAETLEPSELCRFPRHRSTRMKRPGTSSLNSVTAAPPGGTVIVWTSVIGAEVIEASG